MLLPKVDSLCFIVIFRSDRGQKRDMSFRVKLPKEGVRIESHKRNSVKIFHETLKMVCIKCLVPC